MYEEETAINIENRMLDRIDTLIYDKRPGSIIQTSLASTAIELARLYEELNYISEQISPLTADRQFTEGWGEVFSISPIQPTYAIVKATIVMREGTEVPIGSRFSLQDSDLNFTLITKDEDGNYSLQCEIAGEVGNEAYGRILPLINIPGFLNGKITGVAIPGTDLESDDSLKERIVNNFRDKAYGWNIAQYKQEIMKIQGVGGLKLVRYFEEKDFHIGIYIIDSTFHKASEELIELVQETLLPLLPDYSEPTIQTSGEGEVAIGHCPIVMSASENEINIVTHIEVSERIEYAQVESKIRENIENYLLRLNSKWDEQDNILIRISGIESAILDVENVVDVYDTEINGDTSNYKLGEFEICKLGTITNAQ